MRRARLRHRESGFTLLEVLVALVVLGFLMVGLAEGVRAGLALRQAQIRRVGETAELDPSMRVLRRLLTRLPVVPKSSWLFAPEPGASMKGEPERLTFVGHLPTGLGAVRLADMTLYVVDQRLVLAWRPYRHERRLGPPPPATRTVLLSGVERLQLAYWGSPAPGRASAWQARWEARQAPELIRVRLVFARHDPRRWPDLIAASGF